MQLTVTRETIIGLAIKSRSKQKRNFYTYANTKAKANNYCINPNTVERNGSQTSTHT